MLEDSTQRTFIEIATKLGLWDEKKFHKTSNTARLTNGHQVLFRSGENPDKLRGSTVQRIWADECSLLDEGVYAIAIACLRWPGEEMLTFTGTFTPAGKDHWTYRVFTNETSKNVALFRCSTKDNPFLPPQFYENIALEYGSGAAGILRARQELEGEFVCVAGSEWSPECFNGDDLWFNDWPNGSENIRIAALDSSKGIGGKAGDYSSFVKMMYSGGIMWIEADMDNRRDTDVMASQCVEIQKSFQPDIFGIEEEFGGKVMKDNLIQRQRMAGVDMNIGLIPTQGIAKEVRIKRLTRFINGRKFRFRKTEGTKLLVNQMESFPHAAHDDGPDSLEMAVRIAQEMGLLGSEIE
jgi:PBSX family phage terminase large subunit